MDSKKLNDFKETIKELQKIGALSDDDMSWLTDLDKSMNELTTELSSSKLLVSYINNSDNPNPKIVGNKVPIQAYCKDNENILIKPLEMKLIPTGLHFKFHENITYILKPLTVLFENSLQVFDNNPTDNEELIIGVVNHGTKPQFIYPGRYIGDIVFVYKLSDVGVELKEIIR